MSPTEQAIIDSLNKRETGLQLYGGGNGELYTQDDIDYEYATGETVDLDPLQPTMAQDTGTEDQLNPFATAGQAEPFSTDRGDRPVATESTIAQDQTDPFAIAGEADPRGAAASVAGFATGLPLGITLAGLDLVSLPALVADGLISAEEGNKWESVLQSLQGLPSAQAQEFLVNRGKEFGFTDEDIEDFRSGFLTGELSSVVSSALPGLKYLGQGAKYLKGKFGEYAAGAPARVAERNTGTTLQSGIDPMAVVDEAIVGAQSLIPVVKGVKPGDELLVQHNLNPESIEDLQVLGGLPVPSLAIVKSSTPLEKFGSITLIGTPDMAKPSARNPVYRSDAYVRRRPGITFEEDSAPTFYNQKTRKEQKATLKNMVAAMKGRAGEEMIGATAGNLRAIAAKPFKTLAEVKKSRDRLVSEKDMMKIKDEIDRQYIGLVNSVSEEIDDIYARMRDSGLDFSEIMKGLVRGDLNDPEIISRLSNDTKQRLAIFKESATDLPTEYFEVNPQRAVSLDEFKAALVPEDLPESDIKALEEAGVANIIKYKDEADRVEKIKSMRDVMFTVGAAAAVGGGAMKGMTSTESSQGEAQ